jgi:hypothetical protein
LRIDSELRALVGGAIPRLFLIVLVYGAACGDRRRFNVLGASRLSHLV